MDDLEKKLSCLPRVKLSKSADLKIKARLYVFMWHKQGQALWAYLKGQKLYPPPVVLFLLFAIIAVPSYAYTSSSVTRQSLLYPLKREMENIEIRLTRDESVKPAAYVKFAERRLAEAEVLSLKQADPQTAAALREAITEAEDLSRQAGVAIREIKDESVRAGVQEKINEAAKEHIGPLSRIARSVGITADEETLDTIAMAMERAQKNNRRKENAGVSNGFPIDLPKPDVPSAIDDSGSGGAAPGRFTEPDETGQAEEVKPSVAAEPEAELKEQAQNSLFIAAEKVANLKEDLLAEDYDQADMKKLFGRLGEKLDKAQNKIESDELSEINEILKSAEALTNNAKHFIKKQTDKEEDKTGQNRGKSGKNK